MFKCNTCGKTSETPIICCEEKMREVIWRCHLCGSLIEEPAVISLEDPKPRCPYCLDANIFQTEVNQDTEKL